MSLNLVDCNASPPQPAAVKKLLNDVVSASLNVEPLTTCISNGMYEITYQANTPWFDAYRDCLLANIPPSEHEFLGHCLGCVMAVSSSHPDPLDCFAKLTNQQLMLQQQVNRQPRWLCSQVLKYYVLIHDSLEGDQQRADSTLTAMRSTYGAAACHLLLINSRPAHLQSESSGGAPAPPDPWAQHLPPSRQLPASQQHQHQFHQQQHQVVQEASSPTDQQPPQHPLDYGWSSTDSGDVAGPDGGVGGGAPGGGVVGHGAWLSADDHNRLRVMILELVNRALMPWVEKTLKLLNEQIASRMRGKGFLGGAKKWFSVGGGGGSGGSGSGGGAGKSGGQHAGSAGASSVVYSSDAPELQLRRYADLAFLFQQYEVAHQAYQQLKKDFQADAAFLHYAGTMEMAALSAFMQEGTSQRNYPHPYMENAIATYLQNCKNQLLATRGTFLSAEALKTKKMYAEAAVQYIKMTTEDSDLRSALLLEQAAHCYLRMRVPHVRKFAFHLILAGHRFSKAAQRAHSLRCYRAALRVYRDRGWTLAEDHINLVLTKHSAALRELESAKDSAYRLLRHDSRQNFVHVYREFIPTVASPPDYCLIGGALPVLPLPKVLEQELKLLLSRPSSQLDDLSIPARGVHFQDADLCHPEWSGLERALLEAATGRSAPPSFRPSLPCLSRNTPNENCPVAVAGEPLTYQIPLRNPAQIPLILRDVCLLW
uniref:Trafficking protein particle complex subunit 8 n=1 Tax=Macrostomum lignano TaxID=282301 RepID=A0A1I8IKK7_9PLAT